MEEDDEEPWYSWRALATGQGEEDDALDEFDLDDRRYLAVETVYSGFRWGAQGPAGGGLNLESMKVRPAGMSGLVALTHDGDRLALSLGSPVDTLKVRVCTMSGRLVREMDFVSSALGANVKLFDVGWVGDDCLVLASPSGLVHAHHLTHGSYTPLSMGAACEREGLAEMRTSPAGIFFRTKENRFGAVLVDGGGDGDGGKDGGDDRTQFRGPIELDVNFAAEASSSSSSSPPSSSSKPHKASKATKSTKARSRNTDDSLAADVRCFEVVPTPPSIGGVRNAEVVVAVGSQLVRVDLRGAFRLYSSPGPVTRLCPSPDGIFVAAMAATSDCIVVVDMRGTLRLRVDLAPHGTSSMNLRSMAWCGSEAVVAAFEGREDVLVALVDIRGGHGGARPAVTWVEVGAADVHAMSSEIDGVRLLAQDRIQQLRLVPEAVKRVLSPGSTRPSALLLDSRNSVGHEDVRAAAELLDVIEQQAIRQAAADCLDAAGWCTARPVYQERLLRAGIYGEVFGQTATTATDADDADDADDGAGAAGPRQPRRSHRHHRDLEGLARSLRIMNAVLEPDVGMPLSLVQYGALGLRAVVDRLCRTGGFLLALRICDSMEREYEHGRERVLLAWAKRKISSAPVSTDDAELLRELRGAVAKSEKNNERKGDNNNDKNGPRRQRPDRRPGTATSASALAPSWSAIAEHALECGRPQLAAALIEMEPSLKKQVSILLRLGRTDAAMKKAKADGDGDSIWAVLCHRDVRNGVGGVGAVDHVNASASAINNDRDPAEMMRDHYASCSSTLPSSPVASVPSSPFSPFSPFSSSSPSSSPPRSKDKFLLSARVASDRLVQLQKKIESSSGRQGFVGLSVVETLKLCHEYGLVSDVARLVKEFKVSERHAIIVELTSLVERRDWVAIGRLARKLQSKGTGLVAVGARRPVVTTAEIIELAEAGGATENDLKVLTC